MRKFNQQLPQLNSTNDDEQCTVDDAHAFLLKVSRVCGMAPLRFKPRENSYVVSMSNTMRNYSYLIMTFLVTAVFLNLVKDMKLGITTYHQSSFLLQIVSCCDITTVIIITSIGVYGAPSRMRSMIKYMGTIASVDKTIGLHYSPVKECKLLSGLMLSLFIFSPVMLVVNMCFYTLEARHKHQEWHAVAHCSGFYILLCLLVVLEMQFAYSVMLVQARFQAVNKVLSLIAKQLDLPEIDGQNIKSQDTSNMSSIKVIPAEAQSENAQVILRKTVTGELRLAVSPSEAVHRIASVHSTLCNVVHLIDHNYSIPLVVIFIYKVYHLVITPYYTLMEISDPDNIQHIPHYRGHFIILHCVWAIWHILRLIMVVEPCHNTIVEGRQIESHLGSMMIVSLGKGTLGSRLELFSRQLMLQSVCYNPMGLCVLDRPIIAAIFGTAITYMVILMQLQSIADKKGT